MGINQDPVTLHKYLYANADPVNHTDPTGNFSLGSINAGMTINAILTTMSVAQVGVSIFQFSTGERELNAKEIGTVVLLGLAGPVAGKVILKTMMRTCRAKNSFPGETLIHTERGLLPIGEVLIGDRVWSYDVASDAEVWNEVVHLIEGNQEYELYNIRLSNGESFETTGGHPIFTENAGWKKAAELAIDDIIVLRESGRATVQSVEVLTRHEKVYNLTVANAHTFFVGGIGLLVHNCPDDIEGYLKKVKEDQKKLKNETRDTKDEDRRFYENLNRQANTEDGIKRRLTVTEEIIKLVKDILDILGG